MGQTNSSERQMYIYILKSSLKKKDIKAQEHSLTEFLQFIKKTRSLFPDHESLDLEIWRKKWRRYAK